MLLQLSLQLQRQPAGTLHIVTHGTFLGLASTRLNQPLACVITVYKSYLVSTRFSASGNTNAVWLNSKL